MELIKFLTYINPSTLYYLKSLDIKEKKNIPIYHYLEDLDVQYKKLNDTIEKAETFEKIYTTFEDNILVLDENKKMEKIDYNLNISLYNLSLEIDSTIKKVKELSREFKDKLVDEEKLKYIINLDRIKTRIEKAKFFYCKPTPNFDNIIVDLERLQNKIYKKIVMIPEEIDYDIDRD